MATYTIEQIEKLPAEVIEVLTDEGTNARYRDEVYPLLTEEQGSRLSELILDVYFRTISPSAFLGFLTDFIPDEKVRKDVAVKVLGSGFLPISDYLNADIKKLVAEQGGNANLYRKSVPARDVVAELRGKLGLPMADARLSQRLDKILTSRVLNARTDEQTRNLLTGPAKTSGVGLDEATAVATSKKINEEMLALESRGIDVVADEQFDEMERKKNEKEAGKTGDAAAVAGAEVPVEDTEKGIVEPPDASFIEMVRAADLPVDEVLAFVQAEGVAPEAPAAKKDTFETVQVSDEHEIAELKKMVGGDEPKKDTAALIDVAVNDAVGKSGVKFENEDMAKRFRGLLSLYFRGLRDWLETKSKLTMSAASGGMGMNDAEAERVMAPLKAKAEEYHASTSARAEQEKQQYVQAQSEKMMSAADREAQKEKATLDARFASLTGAQPVTAAAAPAPAPVPSQPKVIPVISLDKKPPVPVAPPPANLPVAPAPPAPPASTAPAPIKAAMQPTATVSDVKFTPQLTGPVEELRALTVKDFRRLSKDPSEATLKIKDKIDLLEDQGFELKTQGIKAWQDSEPSRLYLDMLRKSLEGKPVTDVIAELETKGESVLTKAEFDAVMALNRQLRFG